ncbi:MAG: hypothetical protein ACYCZY_07600, partial [Lacisediminihabitans sp.]
LRTDIRLADEPLFIEELVIDGDHQIPGVIGDNRVLDNVLAAGMRGPATPPPARVLEFEYPGSLARYVGMSMHTSPLNTVWASWRDSIRSATAATAAQERPLDHAVAFG